jgi:uridine kinase
LFTCLYPRDGKTGFINWEIPSAFNMEKLVRELENNVDLKKLDHFPNLRIDWEASEVFDSDLSFHEDFLAQVEDLRKASLVFVEGILGRRYRHNFLPRKLRYLT